MKKLLQTLGAFALLLAGGTFISCSNSEEHKNFEELPSSAQEFINTYFANTRVESIEYDNGDKDYEIDLDGGFDLKFNEAGEWTKVEAPDGKTIPNGIAPTEISSYVAKNYPNAGINEIEKTSYGYKVDLTNDLDLKFNPDGTLIGTATATDNTNADNSATANQLPDAASKFITQYFGNISVTSEFDASDNEYDVVLPDGFKLTFDASGNWTDVDAPFGKPIPDGIAPEAIVKYVAANYASNGINEIEKNAKGYKVELTNDVDLQFDANGAFVSIAK